MAFERQLTGTWTLHKTNNARAARRITQNIKKNLCRLWRIRFESFGAEGDDVPQMCVLYVLCTSLLLRIAVVNWLKGARLRKRESKVFQTVVTSCFIIAVCCSMRESSKMQWIGRQWRRLGTICRLIYILSVVINLRINSSVEYRCCLPLIDLFSLFFCMNGWRASISRY